MPNTNKTIPPTSGLGLQHLGLPLVSRPSNVVIPIVKNGQIVGWTSIDKNNQVVPATTSLTQSPISIKPCIFCRAVRTLQKVFAR